VQVSQLSSAHQRRLSVRGLRNGRVESKYAKNVSDYQQNYPLIGGHEMTKTVNIEVYCDTTDGKRDLFGVVSDHRFDLPQSFDGPLQAWVHENFNHIEEGDSITEAGELEYEPNGEIVAFRKK
jgi:hypothetical protein